MISGVFAIPLDERLDASDETVQSGHAAPASRLFIAGSENALVPVAVRAVLEDTTRYNPVVLFGPTGTGKSLLLQGVAERWKHRRRSRLVTSNGADFARAYAHAVQTDSLEDFRARFHSAALLVLDDLQQLAEKQKAQQELILALDALLAAGRRVVVACSVAPRELTQLAPGLISRLSQGLLVPLAPPGPEARRRILEQWAEVQGVELTEPVLALLVEPPGNTAVPLNTAAQLQHAVVQLAHLAEVEKREVDVPLVRQFLLQKADGAQPSLRTITTEVARYFNVRVSELRGSTRRQSVVRARGVAMYLARRLTGTSLQQVGQHFGGRDHTTVLHACRKTEASLDTDLPMRRAIDDLLEQLKLD